MKDVGIFFKEPNTVTFKVWAPQAKSIALALVNGPSYIKHPMHSSKPGYYEITLSDLTFPLDYYYCLNDENLRPDPMSRFQPQGVHGPSRIDNVSFPWTDGDWKGIPLKDYIIYELHVGTFTPEGTFEAIIEKLPYLKSLGITAVELMPIIEFPGARNWGYDGVSLFAPHHAYGGPEGLKKLINAAHLAGIAVILDVVYNHLGPEGNYLREFGNYFTHRYITPWGDAVNFDGQNSEIVRDYFISNALYWLKEFHVDSLRLDAIHTLFDQSDTHILKELHLAFAKEAEALGRKSYIIAESDLNDVKIINPIENSGYGIDAQWNDDFHHAFRTLLTQSSWKYFVDFGSMEDLSKALKNGFVYEGQWSKYRNKHFGSSTVHCPGEKFVICLQNHDQIGNASQGKRLGNLISSNLYRLATTLLFCAPNIPLIFMGQEWNAVAPFLYFTSFEDEKLIENVREGYKREQKHDSDFDPQDVRRFENSKLDWNELSQNEHNDIFKFYQALIEMRKNWKCFSNLRKDLVECKFDEENEWIAFSREEKKDSLAVVIANFSSEERSIPFPFQKGDWKLLFESLPSEKSLKSFHLEADAEKAILVPPETALVYLTQL